MSIAPPAYSACEQFTRAEGIASDAASIAAFLLAFQRERYTVALWNAEAKRMLAFTFERADVHANAEGIASANAGGWNAYFRPNGYAPDADFSGASHPEKTDVRTGFVCHIDADAPKSMGEAERLAWSNAKAEELIADGASLVWFTGGGIQAAKLLREPITLGTGGMAPEEFEEVNVAWANARGGDKCHDCSHLLRIPGTINFPDARKRERGRVPVLARLIAHHPERLHDWASLPREKPKSKPKSDAPSVNIDAAKAKRLGHVDELGSNVPERCKWVIVNGTDPDNPSRWASRSEALHYVACELIRAGVDEATIYAAITNREWAISASVLDKGTGAERYALRQIERARDEVSDDPVSNINRDYFAATEGARTTYYREERDGTQTPMNAEAFAFELAPLKADITDAKGNTRKVPALHLWRDSPRRRYYPRGFVLDPTFTRDEGRYNLWRGFGVPEVKGDWSLIRSHVEEVLADGVEGYADYIIRWTAWKLQNPEMPPRVAIAFRGEEGVGKGFYHNGLVRVFGHHGLRVHSMVQVAGRFNAHMRHLCFLFADEVSVVDDEQEGALKGIITEPTLPIEGKGKDIIQAANHLAVGMASNRKWMIPAGIGARRFAVFNVSNKRKGDADYFSRLFAHAEAGGWSAMLHDLRRMDLEGWHPEANRPTTEALSEQQVQSLRGLERVLADCLIMGEVPCGVLRGSGVFVPTLQLCEYAGRKTREAEPSAREAQLLFGALGFTKDDTARPRGWVLPTLPEARAAWDRVKMPLPWPKVDGWSVGVPDYREGVSDAF
ncbi:MAG: DUF5906 domain-containing protein [Phycisphaerales bacterium]|nr:DUF5906 domain-containing protein [Phycisphaerales bacterium]